MPKYVLDTNVYVRATRDDVWSKALERFYRSFTPFVWLHSVVAAELLAGSVRPELERKTKDHLIRPFEATGRVVTPSHATWKSAGRVVARLVAEKRLSPNGIGRSFLNDCLIAASAREQGLTVVTENARDFELIASVLPVDVVAPWPA